MNEQKQAFCASEGDGWFARNADALASASRIREELVTRVAGHVRAPRATVLEVGCANGANLAALARRMDIRALGIDPSPAAIDDGTRQFAGLDLRVGTADQLFPASGSVDVLWFGFCLYLVDRSLLQIVVAEADRVLREGGLLVIHDFDPGSPRKRQYVHHAGLWSYKMDYSGLFMANPAYSLVEKQSFSHAGLDWDPDPNERVGLWILRKSVDSAYPPA